MPRQIAIQSHLDISRIDIDRALPGRPRVFHRSDEGVKLSVPYEQFDIFVVARGMKESEA
ncbi:hypothetical protein [Aminobacter sp. BE322]|uniref:hypothetical protein n=1 Tax=unclassified Aminobacter TaxID=2644704 RepID=UPI003D1D83FD